ncbi:hydroxysqualene dehydroxylase HpnE [Chitiniphilus purpureus]|uniref:Hydroxysqualene dehydroxylase HpnE n=1 Tax=Chitiniphilus purpureus TaxID=2981137 RepID=A0ABY6DL93_9NEIS|nr:hydroxysqualene dehydroxylase HpnE [Chitiniphilus sp. CD1]UXY15003.1 hydroxysqualene dehydroxylase HpnE [Chitiniphilus sp. CD1]
MAETVTVPRLAVLGGGYAGMAAAVEAASRGARVTVLEAGRVLGGRARRVVLDGRTLDNGQHLLIGAYRELLALMRRVGVDPARVLLRTPLDLNVLPGFRMRCPAWPAPLHLAAALLSARGLALAEQWALTRAVLAARRGQWRCVPDLSVAAWLAQQRQSAALIARFWQPLTVAALNTPLGQASTQVLFNVLRDSLDGATSDSDFLFPRVDFSALLPDAAADWLALNGGAVELGTTVKALRRDPAGWQVNDETRRFDGVICALPPHRLAMALAEVAPALAADVAAWAFQPIVTLYLEYPRASLPQPMLGLSGGLVQWVFDHAHTHGRPDRIAVVLSAEGVHSQLARDELEAAVVAELDAAFGWGRPDWLRSIAEKRATFACVPGLVRPDNATPDPTLWLAGDYTAGDHPATLEGAVRSGLAAARGIMPRLAT